MTWLLWLIGGVLIGAPLGFLTCALVIAAGDAEPARRFPDDWPSTSGVH